MTKSPRSDIVDTPDALHRLTDELFREPRVALDTESNSLYVYREQVCLIQVSTPTQDYLVDTLALDDLSPLGALAAEPGVEKVFHAAEYDLMCLRRDYDFQFVTLFDTNVAARILGWEKVGLASILSSEFDVRVSKRFQRANWGARPLSAEMIRYAKMDTRYLLPLRERLHAELEQSGHLEEAYEAFAEVTTVGPHVSRFDPDGYWNINGVHDLTPAQQAILRELYLYREDAAKQRNLPPFKIMLDSTLLELARRQPSRVGDLHRVSGLNSHMVQRSGHTLLRCVKRGLAAGKAPRPPRRRRPSEVLLARYGALRSWRKDRASERGVVSDVIISKDMLWALAKANPRTPEQLAAIEGLGPWKRKTYGTEILQVLKGLDGKRG